MNKRYILKKNYDIEKLVKKRKSVGDQYYAIYYDEVINTTPKIAISVSKKIGNAVTRNHEKRIHRELFRKHLDIVNNLEILFVVKQKSLSLNFIDKEKDILRLIEIINKKRRTK